MKIFLSSLLVMVILLAGCRSTRPASSVETKDTITVSTLIQERDTSIIAPAAKVSVRIPVKDIITGFKSDLKKDRQASARIAVKDDVLHVDCICDTLAIIAKVKDRYTNEVRKIDRKQTIIVPQKYIPWPVLLLAWIGGGALLLVILSLVINRLKK
ncbi:hypothetical protein GFS24_10280 [Chitinophaga sp. SYP-B3965]|uniref:hypothetical protein n=1 Tax=Chitinophaga sp. SYP-B3965 TaxID=2663120 RepID=UPI001299AEF0|nr:hypothetical protein [Chitinophaga sp. SYP-B3965]MRG45504.1 hypothetical protein [Chitinophaga sp. SYP-B3965]